MKKLIALFLALIVTVSITGCGSSEPLPDCVQSNMASGRFSQIMKSDDGYYYNSDIWKLSLHYYDNATKQSVYLCNKPECLHDGNAFCAATKESFSSLYTAMYNGSIYVACWDSSGEDNLLKLFRASMDGTELSEVCTFMKLSTDVYGLMSDVKNMVIHRGKAFIPINIINSAGAGISYGYIIDIYTGAVVKAVELDEEKEKGPFRVTAEGDFFYFGTAKLDNSLDCINHIYRCDLNGENLEELDVASGIRDTYSDGIRITSYTVIDSKIYYVLNNELPKLYANIYDPETNTTETLSGYAYDETTGEATEQIGVMLDNIHRHAQFTTDGKYLYVANYFFGGEEFMRDVYNTNPNLSIYSLDGKTLYGSMEYDFTALVFPEGYEMVKGYGFGLNVLDGMVYLQTGIDTICCSVDDIIAGKTEWTELYHFENTPIAIVE